LAKHPNWLIDIYLGIIFKNHPPNNHLTSVISGMKTLTGKHPWPIPFVKNLF